MHILVDNLSHIRNAFVQPLISKGIGVQDVVAPMDVYYERSLRISWKLAAGWKI